MVIKYLDYVKYRYRNTGEKFYRARIRDNHGKIWMLKKHLGSASQAIAYGDRAASRYKRLLSIGETTHEPS